MSEHQETRARFAQTAESAQRLAGVVAARHRGDLTGANSLLCSFDDEQCKVAGSVFLCDIVLSLLAQAEGRDIADVASDVSMQLAALTETTQN
ncbi:hypothetical protein CLV47_1166 [Antricoccus suffuscus]|uniref:Uncharacterized protein n=1 Tax=Antricoccus suffuscus TaxID=1629062 RepID=A0A2T0ZVT7_9ACTN|nr:hypothetical protein [Antricoccus suffuscus]PRZ40476.1 hypothetical protein CLV47_1166 [Antricoccus suffuscus]